MEPEFLNNKYRAKSVGLNSNVCFVSNTEHTYIFNFDVRVLTSCTPVV